MNRLKELRKNRKLTQLDIANLLQVSTKTVSRLESSSHEIKGTQARLLADYFGVSVGYLLGCEEIKKVATKKDFIQVIENIKIDVLKNSDNLNSYELSDIKRHARDLYESLVWLQYEAEEKEE